MSHLSEEDLIAFEKEINRDSRLRWRCAHCNGSSRKLRQFTHLTKGCPGKVVYRHNIQRMMYNGHEVVYGVIEPFDHVKWRCRFCKHEWISFDGHWCTKCNRHGEEEYMALQVRNCCCLCQRPKARLTMVKIRLKGPDYKDNIIPVCDACAPEVHWQPQDGDRGIPYTPIELLAHRLWWLEQCAPKCDGSWYRALKEGSNKNVKPSPQRRCPISTAGPLPTS